MRTVQVLLSSYNGEHFIRQQLDSILAQEGVEIKLLVRDDGSHDGTRGILKEYENHFPDRVKVVNEDNVGAIGSFFKLLNMAGGADYYAFSDQDDYWMPDKLLRAVESLEAARGKHSGGLLYSCPTTLVNEELDPIRNTSGIGTDVQPSFGNSLVESICSGCTEVFDNTLLELVKGTKPNLHHVRMHDTWLYMVAACFGTVICDQESHILYRQHGGNELGAPGSRWELVKRRIKRFNKSKHSYRNQAIEFLKVYSDKMPSELRDMAESLVSSEIGKRMKIIGGKDVVRQSRRDTAVMRLMLLLGWL